MSDRSQHVPATNLRVLLLAHRSGVDRMGQQLKVVSSRSPEATAGTLCKSKPHAVTSEQRVNRGAFMQRHTVSLALLLSAFSAGSNTWAAINEVPDEAPEIDLADVQGPIPAFERTVPELASAFYSAKPGDREDGLAVGELSDSAGIIELAKEIEEGKHDPYDSLLIAHDDELVFESYYSRGARESAALSGISHKGLYVFRRRSRHSTGLPVVAGSA